MKILLSLCLAALAVTSAHAQIIRSGIAFRDYDRRGGTTVAVGVSHGHYHGPGPRYGGSPWRDRGYYRSGWYHRPSVYVSTYWPAYGYGYYPGYAYYPYSAAPVYTGSSAAANGLVLGALAGGVIGHNSGEFDHNGWRGAAWGAGIGWLLGTIADANRRPTYTAPVETVPAAPAVQAVPAQQTQAAPQQVTIINNYYNSSPMSSANSLFGR